MPLLMGYPIQEFFAQFVAIECLSGPASLVPYSDSFAKEHGAHDLIEHAFLQRPTNSNLHKLAQPKKEAGIQLPLPALAGARYKNELLQALHET